MSGRATFVTTAVIVALTVALDQITKWWAHSTLDDGRVIEILPTLELDLVYNRGFSFGTGSDFGPLIGVLVLGLIGVLVQQIRTSEHPGRVRILAVILGGAIVLAVDALSQLARRRVRRSS